MPLFVRRYELTFAFRVLYSAVVQNSKKWKSERAPMKSGSCGYVLRRRYASRSEEAKVLPRRNARIAIAERE